MSEDSTARAERIVDKYSGNTFSNAGQAHAWLTNAIATQLDEAMREAELKMTAQGNQDITDSYRRGFAAAREKAITIFEEIYPDCNARRCCLERIRAMGVGE